MVSENILDRIRKLQALANAAGTEAEAALAATRVREMLDRYNLEIGEVELLNQGAYEQELLKPMAKRDHYIHILLNATQTLFGVGGYWRLDPAKRRSAQPIFYGSRANVEAAVVSFDYLLKTIEYLYKESKNTRLVAIGKLFASSSRDLYCREEFLAGAAARIEDLVRAELERRRRAADARQQALIRVTDQIVRDHWTKLTKNHTVSYSESDMVPRSNSFTAGFLAAGGVDVTGGTTKKLT